MLIMGLTCSRKESPKTRFPLLFEVRKEFLFALWLRGNSWDLLFPQLMVTFIESQAAK